MLKGVNRLLQKEADPYGPSPLILLLVHDEKIIAHAIPRYRSVNKVILRALRGTWPDTVINNLILPQPLLTMLREIVIIDGNTHSAKTYVLLPIKVIFEGDVSYDLCLWN